MIGMFAKSLAGHDKEELYLIIMEENGFVLAADGKYKTVSKPKRKSKKHLQIIKTETKEQQRIKAKLEGKEPVSDEEIKRAIKLLKMRKMEE